MSREIVVLGFLPLSSFYERDIKPLLGDLIHFFNPEECIMGEILHMAEWNEPRTPSLTKFLCDYLPSDIKEEVITKFNRIAYPILLQGYSQDVDISHISVLPGYTLIIEGSRHYLDYD